MALMVRFIHILKQSKCYSALEWLQEEYIRQVRIEIENTTLTVKKPRGGILRKIRFEADQKIELFHSTPNPSAMHGPFVLLSQKNNHHLVIRLPSDRDLSKFLDQIRIAASKINAEVSVADEENSVKIHTF